jgi:SAM-dependent methyltransferase
MTTYESRMEGYDPTTYGERIADIYDVWHPELADTEAAVAFLGELAGEGPVLELGVGTGRIAVPLANRDGLEVHGIEASEAMVAKLREKPGGNRVRTVVGDMVDVDVDGYGDGYRLVFATFNTFWMLLSQDDQVRCFENVARRLARSGVFVIEGSVPDPTTLARKRAVDAYRVTADMVVFEVTMRDTVAQRIDRQQVIVDADGFRLQPLAFRYVWPSELDLMARLVGMRLRERFSGWRREPYGRESRKHVSVYELG